MMKTSDMIKEALEKKGFRNLKDASRALGISPEILRVTIVKGHIPKDSTLSKIASKLDLDRSTLILTAHQEKVPNDVKGYFLAPVQSKLRVGKRVFPLSQEQCDYLGKIMSNEEIQLIRKLRQISGEAKIQIIGHVNYMFETRTSK